MKDFSSLSKVEQQAFPGAQITYSEPPQIQRTDIVWMTAKDHEGDWICGVFAPGDPDNDLCVIHFLDVLLTLGDPGLHFGLQLDVFGNSDLDVAFVAKAFQLGVDFAGDEVADLLELAVGVAVGDGLDDADVAFVEFAFNGFEAGDPIFGLAPGSRSEAAGCRR